MNEWDDLKLAYQCRPLEDRLCATVHTFDEDGVYRNRVLFRADVPAFVEAVWERWDPVLAVDW
jgi:hypothetical protein